MEEKIWLWFQNSLGLKYSLTIYLTVPTASASSSISSRFCKASSQIAQSAESEKKKKNRWSLDFILAFWNWRSRRCKITNWSSSSFKLLMLSWCKIVITTDKQGSKSSGLWSKLGSDESSWISDARQVSSSHYFTLHFYYTLTYFLNFHIQNCFEIFFSIFQNFFP